MNLNKKKLTILDKLYIILIDAFAYKSESEPYLTAKSLLSILLALNFIHIILVAIFLLGSEYRITKYHILGVIVVSTLLTFIYYSSEERTKEIYSVIETGTKKRQRRNYFIAIIIYLVSFGLFIVTGFIRSLILKGI